MLGPPRHGMRIELPCDARFSPSATDFIEQWGIEVVRRSSGHTEGTPAWDTPAAFPVVLEGDVPQCTLCGSPVTRKPEHMTQVDARSFGAKNSPRIRFRGKMDSLNALTMLVAARARTLGAELLVDHLGTIAAYCREIISAEYNGRTVEPIAIAGFDDQALRNATHNPATALGLDHLTPGVADPELLHWLNVLRTQVREAEIIAIDAVAPAPGFPIAESDLVRAVNRLSSAVYLLELLYVRDSI